MPVSFPRSALLCTVVAWCSVAPAAEPASQAGHDFFENKIRPVLAARCFDCHAADAQEGKLRLDRRDLLLQGGQSGRAVLPGDPTGSLLIRAIKRVDADLQMPPDAEAKLSPEEIENFVTWVKLGAPFPGAEGEAPVKSSIDFVAAREHWSFRPLAKAAPPELPSVKPNDAMGPDSEIDRFIHARLNAAGMKPSPPADRRALLRRVTYDLTGLPPTPDEIDAFLADESLEAFARVVDRLLASPQYGVHWGRHWLDVARYGDTRWVGAGEDKRWPYAYTYRDWVIAALNDDVPYDRFVTLQLAADQVDDAHPADLAALGFLTVGRWFTGQVPDVIDDQIDVVTRGLLGLTVQCARCHNHKYDAVSTQDYYSLYGLFAAVRMPVDGSGLLASLPAAAPPPIDAAVEAKFATQRRELDEFLQARLDAIRTNFRTAENLRRYLTSAQSVLMKSDNDIRAFAKVEELDDRLLLRWVRYLKNTAKSPHAVFAPWHALAALPEADFAEQAAAVLDTVRSGKLNPLAAEAVAAPLRSFDELADRYVSLFLKYDGEAVLKNADQEAIRQVLRGNDGPPQIPLNELNAYLSAADMGEMVRRKRELHVASVALPERADLYLSYRREATPIIAEIETSLQQRRDSVADEIRKPERIAACLITAREAEDLSELQLRSTLKGRQLSERLVRRWIEYLRRAELADDPVFASWRVFAAAKEQDYAERAEQLAERARQATSNRTVAAAFVVPPKSRAEAAQKYAELLLAHDAPSQQSDADGEAIRQVIAGPDSPLQFQPVDVVDYLAQQELDELKNQERKLQRLFNESAGAPPQAMALQETGRGYAQRVFVRGNPSALGEPAHGGFLTVLAGDRPKAFEPGRGRLELARSIVDRRNPLTARVMVNRVWQWHFGTGLVDTPSDFGVRGSAPSHPELLDRLAESFMADGWSLKRLHRRILLSKTWQQSTADNPKFHDSDPDNRLLWRMNRHRLGFEELRDSLLAAADRLDPTLGGRAVDLTKHTTRRRTAYGMVDRVTLPGFYRYFDFPSPDSHVAERQETIVAQQALYLMNGSFVMQQAARVARRTVDIAEPAERLERMYRLVLGREPSAEERKLGLAYVAAADEPQTDAVAAADEVWHYGFGSYDETTRRVSDFQPFPYFANNTFKGGPLEIDPVLGRMSLNRVGGYAGPTAERAVIRRWVAPRGGRLSIDGVVSNSLHSVQPLGDGVRARIVSSRHGLLGEWIVHGTEEPTPIRNCLVEQGDAIDFVVDGRGREQFGTFNWAPVVYFGDASATAPAPKPGPKPVPHAERTAWDAMKDFAGAPILPEPYGAWEQLAQVLLQSNEFMFLD